VFRFAWSDRMGTIGSDLMIGDITDADLSAAIMFAIDEARADGFSDEEIIRMLTDVVEGLRHGLS
jgi:hypothetical protein